jgi:hypothetical protein
MLSRKEITVLRFNGPRFEDHGLDVDVLSEIVAYKQLLLETAKELWRRSHPTRARLPKGFEDEITLKFFHLEAGSTGVPLVREISPAKFPMAMFFDDELDEAAALLEDAIRAAGEGEAVPSKLPRSVIPLFGELGSSLRENEFLLISAGRPDDPGHYKPARYDGVVKERILAWATEPYTDNVDLTGEVRATDLDGLRFTLRLEGGGKVIGRFKPEHEAVVLEALGEHSSRRMRVIGVGEYTPEDGELKQIVNVERIELIEPELLSEGDIPIWERLASIGKAVPQDAWDNVPTDLSVNVDRYLYGRNDDPH